MKSVTILFLDIDGVFSIPDQVDGQIRYERWLRGLPVWPVPLSYALVRAIAQDRQLHPVWLSSWGDLALLWNERAGTKNFPVGYYLTRRRFLKACRMFPHLVHSDRKLLAVHYYLRQYPDHNVMWIEDGFDDETVSWAAREHHVCLIDTTTEPVLSVLLYEDVEAAARDFVTTYLIGGRVAH
jgi:hypothetical protein